MIVAIKMKVLLLLCLIVVSAYGYSRESQPRGIQMRITDDGLSYAVQVGVGIMEKDLDGKTLPPYTGSIKKFDVAVSNAKLSNVKVGTYRLRTVPGQGMQVAVSDMTLNLNGDFHFKLRSWFPLKSSMRMSVRVGGLSFLANFKVVAEPNGKPSISTVSCNADIKDLHIHFSGGMGWIINLMVKMFTGTLKNTIEKFICKETREQVAKRTEAEMKTFPIVKKIDKWANLDYRLTSSPVFTGNYMDAFLKGKFVSRTAPSPSSLRIPSFHTSSDSGKMVYIWITDYTLNTAGEVYHKSGALKYTLLRNNPKIPSILRQFMTTTSLKPFVPELYKKYPNRPLRFALSSYKAPTVHISTADVGLKIYAKAAVQVELNSLTAVDVFALQLDVSAKGTLSMKKEYLSGSITDTTFNASVSASTIGKVTIPLQNPIIKALIRVGLLEQINPLLEKGIPLPKVDDIEFINPSIQLQQDVIRVETDVQFTG